MYVDRKRPNEKNTAQQILHREFRFSRKFSTDGHVPNFIQICVKIQNGSVEYAGEYTTDYYNYHFSLQRNAEIISYIAHFLQKNYFKLKFPYLLYK